MSATYCQWFQEKNVCVYVCVFIESVTDRQRIEMIEKIW